MTARTCGTCKHYEPSGTMGTGWCRNPRLYAARQSHAVDQGGLDCDRGRGNAWQPFEDDEMKPEATPGRRSLRLLAPQQLVPALAGGGMMASTSSGAGSGARAGGGSGAGFGTGGSGGGTGNWPPQSGPPRRGPSGPPPGQERTVSYQPEERYWTDYLRIALPVLGLLLMLGLFWFWVNELINDDDSATQPTVVAVIDETNTPAPTPTQPAAVALQTTAVTAPQPSPTPPTAAQPSPTPSPPAASAPAQTQGQAPADTGGAQFQVGDVVVVNASGAINMRAQATTSSTPVEEPIPGTPLRITGPAEVSEGITWWPVANDETGAIGYVSEQLIRAQ